MKKQECGEELSRAHRDYSALLRCSLAHGLPVFPFVIQGKAHGHKCSGRGYPLLPSVDIYHLKEYTVCYQPERVPLIGWRLHRNP